MDNSDNIIYNVWLPEDKDTKFSDGLSEVMTTCASVKENIGGKRIRSTNFTPEEKIALINYVDQYKHVIQNKRTDNIWQKRKKAVWEQITKQFNTHHAVCHRSAASLRKLYDNRKKDLRQSVAKDKTRLEDLNARIGSPIAILDDPLLISEDSKESEEVKGDTNPVIKIEYIESATPLCTELPSLTAMPLCTELPSLTGPGATIVHELTPESPEIRLSDRRRQRVAPCNTSSHLTKQYEELVRRKLTAANLKIRKYNNQLRQQAEEGELRKQALLLDLEIKRRTLEKLDN